MRRYIQHLPLILLLAMIASAAMLVPAAHALVQGDHHIARAFLYSGLLTLLVWVLVAITLSSRARHDNSMLSYLLSLFGAYIFLPVILAIPFHAALRDTSFLNAWFEMVSSLTTTGATLFDDPNRLSDTLHLWRALVGWLGGFLMWVAASAILAPLNLGGFEVTASAEPGQGGEQMDSFDHVDASQRLVRSTLHLFPIYAGLTLALWTLLQILGDAPLVAFCHAMSTMSTSGISPIGGVQNASSALAGEMVIFLFLLFALSRMTFSADTITTARQSILLDPEFRVGVLIVLGVPTLLFLRHWISAFDVALVQGGWTALRALWGGLFTVLSFLSTTGFESIDWADTRDWSGLGTPGLILLGLSLTGGGVATTAGGVKLLRVYALYLHGLREMNRLVHPSSIAGSRGKSRRIRRKGAFIAWIFFMLFALSLTAVTLVFAALGASFEDAIVLSISALSTTGPLLTAAAETPIHLSQFGPTAKVVFAATMVLGRLETLAIIALFNPEFWRR